MARKCKGCGALLSSHNPGLLCWPCQDKKKTQLQEQIGDTLHYTVDNLCFLLGLANPESVKRLGRKGTIPGRVPGIRQHLYLREEVDQWIHGAHQEAPKAEVIMQKPHEETLHMQKMRKLAKKLVEIRLPSVRNSFRVWGKEYQGESYSELCNDDVFFVIEIDNRQIAAFADLEGLEDTDYETAEANYAWKMLFTHLDTGGFSGVIDKVRNFKLEMEAYFRCCYEFLKLVEKRIECESRLIVPSSYSEKYGLTPFFTILICVDAVRAYDGLPFIKDSSYRIEEKGSDWVLTCDGLVISIDDSKETLSNYEKMHKDLRLELTTRDTREPTEAITKMRKDLEDTINAVRKDLLTFAGKGTLPGHCELC